MSSAGPRLGDVGILRLKQALSRFLVWERDGFFDALPAPVTAWLLAGGARQIIVRSGELTLFEQGKDGTLVRLAESEVKAGTPKSILVGGRSVGTAEFALEMPENAFLVRRLDLPLQALAKLPDILRGEIERGTPFRMEDVLVGHQVFLESKKAKVWIALLRRDFIEPALEASGLDLSDLAIIRSTKEEGAAGLGWFPVIRLDRGGVANRQFCKIFVAMVVSGCLLLSLGLSAAAWRRGVEMMEVETRIVKASKDVARVRQIADRTAEQSNALSALYEVRGAAPVLTALMEEVSRILPDSAYLSSFRFSGERGEESFVEIVGFAQSAVGLPLLFDRSKLFSDASLVGSVSLDQWQKMEHFVLHLKIRGFVAEPPVQSGK